MPGKTGKRYSDAKRDEIIRFILSRGRGGVAAAKKKYKVSYSAIRYWLKGPITRKSSRALREPGSFRKAAKAGLKGVRKMEMLLKAMERSIRGLLPKSSSAKFRRPSNG